MKFVKGAVIGGLVATGIYMMYSQNEYKTRKAMMKKGKQLIKKIGIV
jgi:hypothetical protein